jgi:hypothetical protein
MKHENKGRQQQKWPGEEIEVSIVQDKSAKKPRFITLTMPTDYGKWTVLLLKKELVSRGAKLTGRKAELIDRLEAYDRNDDFRGAPVIQLPESLPMPAFPEISSFRTLTNAEKDLVPKVRISFHFKSTFTFAVKPVRRFIKPRRGKRPKIIL